MVYKIGMLSIFVRDVAQSTKFYTDVFGFTLQEQFSNEAFALGELAGGPTIALRSLDQLPAGAAAKPGGIEINFEVEDIESAWQDWKAKDISGLTEVSDMGAGLNFSAKDPDGHCLNVYQLYDFMK